MLHEIKDLNSLSPATGARTGQGAASIQQLNCFTLVKQWKMSVGALPTVSLWVTTENDAFIVLGRDYFNNSRTFGRITENSVCVNAIHTSIRFRLSIHTLTLSILSSQTTPVQDLDRGANCGRVSLILFVSYLYLKSSQPISITQHFLIYS